MTLKLPQELMCNSCAKHPEIHALPSLSTKLSLVVNGGTRIKTRGSR